VQRQQKKHFFWRNTMNTTQNTRRNFFSVASSLTAVGAVALATGSPVLAQSADSKLTRQVYDAFQRGQFDRWDALFAEDVVTNSSAGFGIKGLAALKAWGAEFLTAFSPRVDLVDEINAVDSAGNGRAVMTFNLNWHHVKPFFGTLQPTGRTGTSVENMIMAVRNGKITRIEVADTTVDLVIYMHERGWIFPQNVRPEPIIRGIERPANQAPVSLK
jgi:ketosteroid isomerase-like protein